MIFDNWNSIKTDKNTLLFNRNKVFLPLYLNPEFSGAFYGLLSVTLNLFTNTTL